MLQNINRALASANQQPQISKQVTELANQITQIHCFTYSYMYNMSCVDPVKQIMRLGPRCTTSMYATQKWAAFCNSKNGTQKKIPTAIRNSLKALLKRTAKRSLYNLNSGTGPHSTLLANLVIDRIPQLCNTARNIIPIGCQGDSEYARE